MFTIEGNSTRLCDGVSRRQFMRVGGLGTLGVALPQLLRSPPSRAAEGSPTAVSTFGKAKRCILLYMWGGPPHHDTFDMKPDAPTEVRGEFSPIHTNVPGMFISDHLPLLSQHADKFTVVRSVNHKNGDHISQCHDMLTGNAYVKTSPIITARPTDHPHYGAVLSHLKPRGNGLPAYVQLPCVLRSNSGKVIPGQHGGFLGKKYDPFLIDAVPNKPPSQDPTFERFTPSAFRMEGGITVGRLGNRRGLVDTMNRRFRQLDESRVLEQFDGVHQEAFSLLSSTKTRQAFDLGSETPERRDRYGRHTFGQGVLMARRLVEAGVPLVTVYWRNGPVRTDIGWDNHINNFPNLKNWQLPPVDRAFSALLEDLSASGMLEDTLVVWMGEFGRSPHIDAGGGRQHWPQCYSVVMAGGGIRGGELYGASDEIGAYPADKPVSPIELGATIYHLLGLDGHATIYDHSNRPSHVCRGMPIAGLV